MARISSNKGLFIVIIAVLALLAGGALWLSYSSQKGAAQGEAKPPVKAALTVRGVKLAEARWARTLAANGSVVAWQEAVIGAELSGLRIAAVKVNVGDRVRRGDLLASLAADTQQAGAAESRAALLESEALLAEAAADAERARKLRAAGFISEQQVTRADIAEQAARARMEVQRAKHQADALRLAQTRIAAPDDGIISARSATVGTLTQPGAELFRLIRQGRLEWRAELTADELAQVRKGMAVELTPVQGQAVQGKVIAVSPGVDAKTRYGQVQVELPESAHLVAGQFARGVIKLDETGVTAQTLPQTALVLREGVAYVFVITADNKVQERKVGTGARSGDRVEITSGLEPGVAVVESGGAFLAGGDVVRLTAAR